MDKQRSIFLNHDFIANKAEKKIILKLIILRLFRTSMLNPQDLVEQKSDGIDGIVEKQSLGGFIGALFLLPTE